VSAAALALAALLLWLALPAQPRPARRCPQPARAGDRIVCDGQGAPLAGPARLLFGGRLDANTARAAWLEALPGIGPARAAALVAERERAPFCGLEDLARVRGIGPRTLARLGPWLEADCRGEGA
jgi:competence protein ComEA